MRGIIAVVFAMAASPAAAGPDLTGYRTVLDDEFSGNSLDTSKWNYNWFAAQPTPSGAPVTDQFALDEDAAYSSAQVSVHDGSLHLLLEARPTTVTNALGTATHPYISGMVQTRGKFQVVYGYAEARMYVPDAGGKMPNWPAFWLANASGETKELDSVEGQDGHAEYHYHDAAGAYPSDADAQFGVRTGWHVYGVMWNHDGATFWCDGFEVGHVRRKIPASPVYVDLAQAAQANVGGPNTAPVDVQFDYVKVWAR